MRIDSSIDKSIPTKLSRRKRRYQNRQRNRLEKRIKRNELHNYNSLLDKVEIFTVLNFVYVEFVGKVRLVVGTLLHFNIQPKFLMF